jgi:hypothetical protein
MATRTFRPVASLLLISALSLVAPGSLRAADLVIDDTDPNEAITVSANDFELGVTSDVDVPETTSWLLFGSAFLGFVSYVVRKRFV